jgi:hypothetical protein
MIRLNLNPEPAWLELVPGVRVRVAPLNSALIGAARTDPFVADLPAEAPREAVAVAMAKAIGAVGILEWEGVGDADGYPLAPSREAVSALMDVFPIFEAFQMGYVAKGLVLESEKNVSAPSPNGTSEGATDTAPPAPAAARNARRG